MKEKQLERIWTKSFIGIFLTQFLVFTTFYTLLTTLPIYVIQDLTRSQSDAGLVVTFMLVSAIIMRPFTPKVIDILGKKKSLLLSVTLFTITTFIYIWIDQFIPLLMLRFIHGISFAVLTNINAVIVVDVIPQTRRGAGMGYFAMAMNLAVVVGPFVGLSLLAYVSFQQLFTIVSFLVSISLFCVFMVNVPDEMANDKKEATSVKIKMSDLIEVKALPVSLISGLVGISYASILSFISIYADSIGLSSTASYFFLVFAIVMIAFRPYLGRAYDERGPRTVLIPSLLIFAAGLAFLGLTRTSIALLLAAGLIGLGYGTLLPGFQTLAIQSTENHRNSHALSTFFIFYEIDIATGAYIWGLVTMGFGFEKMYFSSALLIIITTFIFNHLLTRQGKKFKREVL